MFKEGPLIISSYSSLWICLWSKPRRSSCRQEALCFHANLGHAVLPRLGAMASGGQSDQVVHEAFPSRVLAAPWGARMLFVAQEPIGWHPLAALEIALPFPSWPPSPPCQHASLPLWTNIAQFPHRQVSKQLLRSLRQGNAKIWLPS